MPSIVLLLYPYVHNPLQMPFCTKAKLDDGLFDVVSIAHGSRIALIKIMEAAKKGTHENLPLGA